MLKKLIHRVSLRIAKLKNGFGSKSIKAVANHNERKELDEVRLKRENIDHSKSHLNRRLYGAKDTPMDELLHDNLERRNIKPGKNQVLSHEIIISASPGYFRDDPDEKGKYDSEKMKAWAIATKDWAKKEFGKNLVCIDLHLDETTPHMHIIVTPVKEVTRKRRRTNEQIANNEEASTYTIETLAASKFGPEWFEEMQDKAAEAVKHLGIERGIKGSKAVHKPNKKYHAEVKDRADRYGQVMEQTLSPFYQKIINLPEPKEGFLKNENAKDYRQRIENYLVKNYQELYDKTVRTAREVGYEAAHDSAQAATMTGQLKAYENAINPKDHENLKRDLQASRESVASLTNAFNEVCSELQVYKDSERAEQERLDKVKALEQEQALEAKRQARTSNNDESLDL